MMKEILQEGKFTVTPEEIAMLQARYANQDPGVEKDLNDIIELGRNRVGAERFDQASQQVADVLGPDKLAVLREALPHYNAPVEAIVHLSENENRLKAMKNMSTTQILAELARVEAEQGPTVAHGVEPAWKGHARNKGVSAEEWRTTGGANIKSAAEWNRAFDKHTAERSKRVR
jgi:hypothetical protein